MCNMVYYLSIFFIDLYPPLSLSLHLCMRGPVMQEERVNQFANLDAAAKAALATGLRPVFQVLL